MKITNIAYKQGNTYITLRTDDGSDYLVILIKNKQVNVRLSGKVLVIE